eukprot:IDg18521t1
MHHEHIVFAGRPREVAQLKVHDRAFHAACVLEKAEKAAVPTRLLDGAVRRAVRRVCGIAGFAVGSFAHARRAVVLAREGQVLPRDALHAFPAAACAAVTSPICIEESSECSVADTEYGCGSARGGAARGEPSALLLLPPPSAGGSSCARSWRGRSAQW